MINTLTVSLAITGTKNDDISLWDPRILLAAQQVLVSRPHVMQAPDMLPVKTASMIGPVGRPTFAVALDDYPRNGSQMAITTLVSLLTEPATVRVVFAEDGGWKVRLVDLDFSVLEL